ncbi:MAG: hypothetical protein VW313_11335, partial [Gammaproteobacteria bacterium]
SYQNTHKSPFIDRGSVLSQSVPYYIGRKRKNVERCKYFNVFADTLSVAVILPESIQRES